MNIKVNKSAKAYAEEEILAAMKGMLKDSMIQSLRELKIAVERKL